MWCGWRAGQTLGVGWVIDVLASKSPFVLPHLLHFLCYHSDIFPLDRLGKLITGVLFELSMHNSSWNYQAPCWFRCYRGKRQTWSVSYQPFLTTLHCFICLVVSYLLSPHACTSPEPGTASTVSFSCQNGLQNSLKQPLLWLGFGVNPVVLVAETSVSLVCSTAGELELQKVSN